MSLGDEVLEHAAAGRQIGDVVLVDRRWDHQQRVLVHRGCGGLVLDELINIGAGHHRSRRRRDVLADRERVGLHHRRDAGRRGHIGNEGTEAPEETQAAAVDGRLPRDRADQRVVARRGGGNKIGQHEFQALVVPPVQPGVGEQLLGGLAEGQVGLNGPLQQRILHPGGIGEPAVAARRSDRRTACRDSGELGSQQAGAPGHGTRTEGQVGHVVHGAGIRPEPAQRAESSVGREQIQRAGCIQLARRVDGAGHCCLIH